MNEEADRVGLPQRPMTQPHLVERAAVLLRDGTGLGAAPSGNFAHDPIPEMPRRPAGGDAASALDAAGAVDASVMERPVHEAATRGTRGGGGLFAPEPASRAIPPDETAGDPLAPSEAAPGAPPGAPMLDLPVMEGAGLIASAGKRTRAAEEYSISAGNLLRAVRAAQKPGGGGTIGQPMLGNLLMVTSSKPDEGKSFCALNLAASLARNGLTRVLLVDIDPKLGSMTTRLGLDGRPGLLDVASDKSLKPEALAVPTAIRDLVVMPLGTRDASRGDRGIASQLAIAVERIGRRFAGHLVVLDAPPCLATSEPSGLAPLVGVIAMVVEAERTQREELEHALELVKTCPNIVLLLNKVRGTAGHAFGDYDYYGA